MEITLDRNTGKLQDHFVFILDNNGNPLSINITYKIIGDHYQFDVFWFSAHSGNHGYTFMLEDCPKIAECIDYILNDLRDGYGFTY